MWMIAFFLACGAQAQEDLKPFTIDWGKADQSLVDWSAQLPKPAGRDGFILVKGERMYRPDGSRFRIWGVNLCATECFPTKQEAALLAADLARMGVNCVRFHHMDAKWAGAGIFDDKRDDTRQLSAERLDRLDYFIAQLKQRGIYSNLNLNVSRYFKPGDGVRDPNLLGYGKSATYFNPRLIELQHEFARQLLTHKNPYTGNEYRHEPAIATVEIINENSVLEGWVGWRLIGKDVPNADTWSPIPVSYAEELTDLYNQWLVKNIPAATLAAIRAEAGAGPDGRVKRLAPNEFAKASKERFHAEASFLMEVERSFFVGMKKLLKDELGVKAPIIGTADHNDGYAAYAHIDANQMFDIIDGHGYWEHPDMGRKWIKNTPMVNDPLDATVTQFARTPVVGRPYTISETNHPFPHEYACEGYPILTTYALMHDWDGIYWFNFGAGRRITPNRGMGGYFDFSNDPVKMTNLIACAAMWHRQDVKAAPTTVVRSYTREQMIEALRMDRKERPFFTPGFARSTALQMRTRFTLNGAASAFPAEAPLGAIESETKQIGWYNADQKKGIITVDTPNTQALIGFVKGSGRNVRHLSAEVETPFCALMLTSLDGKPIEQSSKLLMTATAKATNSGFKWKEDRQTIEQQGAMPAMIDPVKGRISLRNLGQAKGLAARALSPEGQPLGALPVTRVADGWQIQLGEPATTWAIIEVSR